MTEQWIVPAIGTVTLLLTIFSTVLGYLFRQNSKLVDDLRKRVGDLETKNADIERHNGDLKDKIDGLEDERDDILSKLQTALDLQRKAQTDRATEAVARAEAETARDSALAANVRLNEQIDGLKREVDAWGARLDNLKAAHQQEIDALTARVVKAEQVRAEAEALVLTRNGELKQRDQLIAQLRFDLSTTQKTLHDAKAELDDLQTRLKALEKKDTGKLPALPIDPNQENSHET